MAKHWDNTTTFKSIDEIAKNPILYDSKCVGYTNRDARRTVGYVIKSGIFMSDVVVRKHYSH